MTQRAQFLQAALSLIGVPYLYGGKDPARGIDCSGVVTYALRKAGGPDWRNSHNTDKLWAELRPTKAPSTGDLAFYGGKGPDDVEHVMVLLPLDGDVDPDLVVGASGGDSTTTTLREAMRREACVKVIAGLNYRDDFRGFRKLPF